MEYIHNKDTKNIQYSLTKELLNKLRNFDGFPVAKDEDIIALSDPPYYTACPNPWLNHFIEENTKLYDSQNDNYNKEPFAFDVSEGKNDPIYNAHSYHTKVPHKAIMRYILHYTDPGDIVFDGFCGTGMTGVAAQMCGLPDGEFKLKIDKEMPSIKWGPRKSILCDLSPIATFIAYNYNIPVDVIAFEKEAKRILDEMEKDCGWMYETDHTIDGKVQYKEDIKGTKMPIKGKINYTVLSDVFICPECSHPLVYWDIAVDKESKVIKDQFNCPYCTSLLHRDVLDDYMETVWDESTKQTILMRKQVPVIIKYFVGSKLYEKKPDQCDLEIIRRISGIHNTDEWYPSYPMMFKGKRWGDTWRAGVHIGITSVNHFYTLRNIRVLAKLKKSIDEVKNKRVKLFLNLLLTSFNPFSVSKLTRYNFEKRGSGPLSGTLYVPSFQAERNVFTIFETKMKAIKNIWKERCMTLDCAISTQSSKSSVISNVAIPSSKCFVQIF
jgi:rubredoxin